MKMNGYKLLCAFILCAVAPMVMADNFYDDDIYFDASKAKKKNEKMVVPSVNNQPQIQSTVETFDYSGYSGSTRDVDEYNRQGIYSYSTIDSTVADSSLIMDGYTYTNRIERFYNPEIVSGSGNQELIESYNANQPIINIYIDDYWDPYPSWTWGYSYPGYSWGYPYYTWTYSHYTGVWNPYWTNYGWYNPWYWTWGWSYPYCYHYPYYYHYYHHHHYYPSHHHHAGWRPTSPGAYRPHRSPGTSRPGYNSSARRPGYNSNRGNSNYSGGTNFGTSRGRNGSIGSPSNSRPRNMSDDKGNYRKSPGVNNNTNRRGSLQQDGSSNRSSNRNSNSRLNSGSSRSSSGISRPNSGSSNRSSGSSFSRPSSGGSRSSGGFSGGGSRGGGGGRGRR